MNTDILATDGTYIYIFDANGNLISWKDVSDPEQDSYWSYSYDVDNRLTKVERVVNGSTSKTINYWYDPMGNLVKKTCTIGGQSTTTDYTVDIAQGLPVVLIEQRSGGETLLYTYGEDLLKVSKDGDYYYFYDGLGSTRTITSGAAGTVVAEYLYDAYGAQLLTGQPAWNTRLFTGEPRDPDTGLIYLRARWYDPGIGRFVSRDSYGGNAQDPLSLHRYIYCGDDPINHVDPTGNSFLVEFSATNIMRGIIAGTVMGGINAAFSYARGATVGQAAWSGVKTAALTGCTFISPLFVLGMAAITPVQLVLGISSGDITTGDIPEFAANLAAGIALFYLFRSPGVNPAQIKSAIQNKLPQAVENLKSGNSVRGDKWSSAVKRGDQAAQGSLIHAELADLMRAENLSNLRVEVSCNAAGAQTSYGAKGSVRLDYEVFHNGKTVKVYDLKPNDIVSGTWVNRICGRLGLSPSQIEVITYGHLLR